MVTAPSPGGRWTKAGARVTLVSMLRLSLLALAVLASALAGCAGGPDRVILDHPPPGLDRSNGQPRLWPCMIGDPLCGPQP